MKDSGRFVRPEHQRWMATGREFAVGDTVRVSGEPLEGRVLRLEQIAGRMATVVTEFFRGGPKLRYPAGRPGARGLTAGFCERRYGET